MPESNPEKNLFLRCGDVVNVGIDLPSKIFAEDVATVVANENGELFLNLCGNGFPGHLSIKAGSKITITRGEGRTIYHGRAKLKSPPEDSILKVEFPRRVTVVERREHLRVDVTMPVRYYMPINQNMGRVISEWNALKKCEENCRNMRESSPGDHQSRVNLSGSGLRFKIRDCLPYGSLLHLLIDLPGTATGHIHAVGSIVRTKELASETGHIEYYSSSMAIRMIDYTDREHLLNHILQEQRNNMDVNPSGYL